ncbi:MAG: hypothetical protein K2Q03_10275 [Sphingobacteriaceae bacterium]|nr:hypothetical protein [Sphingobacteriaceae bacterium]
MYNSLVRYIFLLIFGSTGLLFVYLTKYELASVAGFTFCFVLWSHFKHGSVLLASKHFKNGDYAKTEKLLNEVSSPDRLSKNRRGYYEFMKGNIALKKELFNDAETHFQIASRFPVGNKNDKAYVLIHLANLALRKKDKERAAAYSNRAKELTKSARAQEIINKIEIEISKID